MSDLKQLYRQAVIGRIAELEAALREASSNNIDSDLTLRRIAHSLRGSGGTYGFPEVTTAAGAVEDAHTGEIVDRTADLLAVLRGVIDGGPRPLHVLIIDDDPEIQLLLRTVLAQSGRELVTAESGSDAMHKLKNTRFSLIILDLLLPDLDGRDVLKRIRKDELNAKTPVIVLSAKTTAETRRECEALGATAFFEKPFDPEAVGAAVGAQLLRVADSEPDAKA